MHPVITLDIPWMQFNRQRGGGKIRHRSPHDETRQMHFAGRNAERKIGEAGNPLALAEEAGVGIQKRTMSPQGTKSMRIKRIFSTHQILQNF
jgi:hypothetical protein